MSSGLKPQITTQKTVSPYSDAYCEKVYKSFHDSTGVMHERVQRAMALLDIDPQEIMPR